MDLVSPSSEIEKSEDESISRLEESESDNLSELGDIREALQLDDLSDIEDSSEQLTANLSHSEVDKLDVVSDDENYLENLTNFKVIDEYQGEDHTFNEDHEYSSKNKYIDSSIRNDNSKYHQKDKRNYESEKDVKRHEKSFQAEENAIIPSVDSCRRDDRKYERKETVNTKRFKKNGVCQIDYDRYYCSICNREMAGEFNVHNHIKGGSHRENKHGQRNKYNRKFQEFEDRSWPGGNIEREREAVFSPRKVPQDLRGKLTSKYSRKRSKSRGRSSSREKIMSRGKSERRSSSKDEKGFQDKVRKALIDLRAIHEGQVKMFLDNPAAHPDYRKEYDIWCQHRAHTLSIFGHDPRSYDYTSEWMEYWPPRMMILIQEQWDNMKTQCITMMKEKRDKRILQSRKEKSHRRSPSLTYSPERSQDYKVRSSKSGSTRERSISNQIQNKKRRTRSPSLSYSTERNKISRARTSKRELSTREITTSKQLKDKKSHSPERNQESNPRISRRRSSIEEKSISKPLKKNSRTRSPLLSNSPERMKKSKDRITENRSRRERSHSKQLENKVNYSRSPSLSYSPKRIQESKTRASKSESSKSERSISKQLENKISRKISPSLSYSLEKIQESKAHISKSRSNTRERSISKQLEIKKSRTRSPSLSQSSKRIQDPKDQSLERRSSAREKSISEQEDIRSGREDSIKKESILKEKEKSESELLYKRVNSYISNKQNITDAKQNTDGKITKEAESKEKRDMCEKYTESVVKKKWSKGEKSTRYDENRKERMSESRTEHVNLLKNAELGLKLTAEDFKYSVRMDSQITVKSGRNIRDDLNIQGEEDLGLIEVGESLISSELGQSLLRARSNGSKILPESEEIVSSTTCEEIPNNLEVRVMKMLLQVGEKLGPLNMPLQVLHDKAIQFQRDGKDCIDIFKDSDTKLFLNLVNEKINYLITSESSTVLQKTIYQDANTWLEKLLKRIDLTSLNEKNVEHNTHITSGRKIMENKTNVDAPFERTDKNPWNSVENSNNNVIKVLRTCLQVGEKISSLIMPLQVLYDQAIQIQRNGGDSVDIFKDSDGKLFLNLVNEKITNLIICESSTVQRAIYQDTKKILDGLLNRVDTISFNERNIVRSPHISIDKQSIISNTGVNDPKEIAEETYLRGVNVDRIAKVTIGKGSSETIDFIKNALSYLGDENPSHDTLMEIYMAVKGKHIHILELESKTQGSSQQLKSPIRKEDIKDHIPTGSKTSMPSNKQDVTQHLSTGSYINKSSKSSVHTDKNTNIDIDLLKKQNKEVGVQRKKNRHRNHSSSSSSSSSSLKSTSSRSPRENVKKYRINKNRENVSEKVIAREIIRESVNKAREKINESKKEKEKKYSKDIGETSKMNTQKEYLLKNYLSKPNNDKKEEKYDPFEDILPESDNEEKEKDKNKNNIQVNRKPVKMIISKQKQPVRMILPKQKQQNLKPALSHFAFEEESEDSNTEDQHI